MGVFYILSDPNNHYYALRFACLIFCAGLFLNACLSAGTHGKIKSYTYNVPKAVLQSAVEKVIADSESIVREANIPDTMFVYEKVSETTSRSHFRVDSDYYNDGNRYLTIKISQASGQYRYTLHYYGYKEDWPTSKTSTISIVYGFTPDHRGGSEGNGGVTGFKSGLKKELIKPFEEELIYKLDSILGPRLKEID